MSIRQGDIIISGLGTMLPAQSGQSGKFLTTDGSTVSWGDVDTFPDQLGNSGKFLTTNGQAVSWATVTIPTVDQTYSSSSTSTNALSHKAIANAKFIQNIATGTNSITILGTASSNIGSINIGELSSIGLSGSGAIAIGGKAEGNGSSAIAIGYEANATAAITIGIGYEASARATYAIQLGQGTNSESNSFYVGLSSSNNYKLLGSNGKIPDDRLNTTIARTSQIPTTVAELTDSSNYLTTSDVVNVSTVTLATVATTGSYNDLSNKPTIPTVNDSTITIQKNGTTVDSFTTNASSGKTINITVPTTASDVGAVAANSAITGATKCKITYDSKGLVTAGANLSASDIPDISATYQTKITSTNKISADNISDGTTNKTVTSTEKSTWSGKQDALISGTNIKTINSTSLLGSGNISITGLPSQTSQSGKFLTTNGTTASWATVDALPSQSGNSGKFLTTNGTTASWATVTQPSIATTSTAGLVKPDGTTITVTNDGTITAATGSAYAMVIVDYTAEEE